MLTFDEIVFKLRKHFKTVSTVGAFGLRISAAVDTTNWEDLLQLLPYEHLLLHRSQSLLRYGVYRTIEGQFSAVCKELSKRRYHLSVVTYEHLLAVGATFEQLFVVEDFVDNFKSEATHLDIGYKFDATGVWIGWRDQAALDEIVVELRKNFVVELHSTPLEHAASWNLQLGDLASRINVVYGQTCTHLELYKNGNYVDIVGHAKDFDRILVKMRAVHKVVDVCPQASFTNHVDLKDWVKIPAVDHLLVCYEDGRLYYNVYPTEFDYVLAKMRHFYGVKPFLDEFEQKHEAEEVDLTYEITSEALLIKYSLTYKTLTLSCEHLAHAKPRFCGDRLPHCPCNLPRNVTIEWTQRASNHKIVDVRILDGIYANICMECGPSMTNSLAFMRNPLALIDKNKPESGVYCMPCYETMRQQLLAMFPE